MIKSEKEYMVIVERMDELLAVSENIENPATKGYVELNLLSDMMADYQENHHPVHPPTLSEALKHRIYERG